MTLSIVATESWRLRIWYRLGLGDYKSGLRRGILKLRCSARVIAERGVARGRILGRNWDKTLKSFSPCYSHSLLLTDFTHPPPPRKIRG